MIRLLIVGSKGFIGLHAMEYFSARAEYIVYGSDVVADYVSGKYFQIDAANSDFQELFQQVPFDVCLNCSGAASVPDSLVHPHRDFLLNTVNVHKILEAIRKYAPACRFINLSSAAVYGNPPHLPVKEDAICNPVSPYGCHKQQAEMICKEFYVHFGIKTCSIRIFSAYGEGLKKQLFWDLAQKIKLNTIALYGTGDESRDFIHVKDIVRSMELVVKNAAFKAECYNIANGVQVSVREAASLLLSHLHYEGQLVFQGNMRPGDPLYWQADISKILQLGYSPEYSIDKGLKRYAEWLQEEKLV
jgi:UDP-glucose 4-epimerase